MLDTNADEKGRLRKVSPIRINRVGGAVDGAPLPTFEWLPPEELLVNESYQRNLSQRSMDLIRKIVGDWDWARFKPPIVAPIEHGYEIIDGQHTAIAAASHPRIDRIPVMLICALHTSNRAAAFIGHNRDRVAITPLQIHNASCAAGEVHARALQAICDEAGIVLLPAQPCNGKYLPGETVAVGTVQRLLSRRGEGRSLEVLKIAAGARLAPVSASAIRAIEMLLFDSEFTGHIGGHDIEIILKEGSETLKSEAKMFSATHGTPLWKALGSVIFQKCRKMRRRPAANGADTPAFVLSGKTEPLSIDLT